MEPLWQCDVPAPNAGFVTVAGGEHYSLGLKSDGTIVAWGWNSWGQCDVPAPNADFVALAAGSGHALGVRSDGTIVAWGRNDYGQCNVPAPNAGFVAAGGGNYHSLGLKSDGTIVAWGRNAYGESDPPVPNADFVAVAVGHYHNLGLRSDGMIVAWGWNTHGECDIPAPNADFVAVAAGADHSLGLKSDGLIVAFGSNGQGQCAVPAPNTDFVAVASGRLHSLGLNIGYRPVPMIASILDAPNDQGRQARIRWWRSMYDAPGDTVDITGYGVYRRQDELMAARDATSNSAADPATLPDASRLDGWDYLMTVPANGEPAYQVVAPTLCDSTETHGICWSVFLVRAYTTDPFTFFDSSPDSGYSIDNLAPEPPAPLGGGFDPATGDIVLTWSPSSSDDLQYYEVHRGVGADFVPVYGNRVYADVDTVFADMSLEWDESTYYKVTAVDFGGNRSGYLSISALATDVPEEAAVEPGMLQNAPNPFVASSGPTSIAYSVASPGGSVRISIYDLSGRSVRTLVDERKEPGEHAALWDGKDDRGMPVSAGVYFVRLEAAGEACTRKLVLVR